MIVQYLVTLLLFFHGLIHVAGVFFIWNTEPMRKRFFKKNTSTLTVVGYCWIMTGLLFIFSAVLFFRGWSRYWIVVLGALVFSQALIFRYWPLSKYGTIVNGILLVAVAISASSFNFEQRVSREITSLNKRSRHLHQTITKESLDTLPNIVRTWLIKSGVVNKGMPATLHVIQKGELRLKNNGPWNNFRAEQYFSLDPPAFVWDAEIDVNGFLKIKGRDKFEEGKGNMLIKAESFFPIADSKGPEIDQGTLVRFMAEMSWFPQSAIKEYVRWKQTDSTHALASITYGSTSVSGVFTFGSNGLPMLFEAQRYGEFDGKFLLETWSVKTTGYKTFNGVTVGSSNEVTWKLKDGDFTWLKLEVTQLDFSY